MKDKGEEQDAAAGRKHNARRGKIILFALTALAAAAALLFLWMAGAFLPGWIEWHTRRETLDLTGTGEEVSVSLSDRRVRVTGEDGEVLLTTDWGWKVADFTSGDLDGDGADDLILLLWKRGSYGHYRPFWVKHDDPGFSEHLFIYSGNRNSTDGGLRQKWGSSALGVSVQSFSIDESGRLHLVQPDGEEKICVWRGFGLKYVDTEAADGSASGREETKLTVFCAGDNLAHESVCLEAMDSASGTFDFSPVYEQMKDEISAADLAVINQETILVEDASRRNAFPIYSTPVSMGDALVNAGFDVILSATNHANDMGQSGLADTLNYWRKNHPETTVCGLRDMNADGTSPVTYIEKKGLRIGILNFTYGVNGSPPGKSDRYQIDILDENGRENLISGLREADGTADFVLCFLHIGEEYSSVLPDEDEELVREAAEAGADVIVCSHSHVAGPMKTIQTASGRKVPVYEGLGNFMSNQTKPETVLGAAAGFTLVKDDEGCHVEDADMIPTVCHFSEGTTCVYRLSEYGDRLASEHTIAKTFPDFSVEWLWKLWEEETGRNIS